MAEGYTVILNSIIDAEELSNIQEFSILIALHRFYNADRGYAFPSYAKLKKTARISDTRTLSKAIEALISNGYIRKETARGVGCKYYILKDMTPSGELHLVENSTTCNFTPEPSGDLHLPNVEPSGNLHHDLVENYTTTNNNSLNNYLEHFESIWKLYPNKKGKHKIKDTQKKKLFKIGYEEISRCIERYKKGKPDWQEWQYGSTFFNGGFEDYLDSNYQDKEGGETNDGYIDYTGTF